MPSRVLPAILRNRLLEGVNPLVRFHPLDVLIPSAVAVAGIIIVRAVFAWRIFDRKKKRHDDDLPMTD